ncbi:hypothetical protein AB0G02_42110 [Actinosynnema sp. NPDC023658]|uniref:allene oxide cyclase barrel-like domain-containing protein n=1 Tax=Actinosynnema sp. NPDC023658 TaxID=3155465 RepID=UPI0033C7F58E
MRVQPWLVVLAVAGTLVGADQAAGEERTTLELTAGRTLMSAPANLAVGMGFVSGGDPSDGAGRAKVGEGYSHCGITKVSASVPPAVTAHCTSVFRLADGELHLSGLREYKSIANGFESTTKAVVGGTGKYANARGEVEVARATAANGIAAAYRFTFDLVD